MKQNENNVFETRAIQYFVNLINYLDSDAKNRVSNALSMGNSYYYSY